MGAQCKKVNQFSIDKKYSMMKPQNHAIFGQIFWFNNQKDGGKAIKRLSCDSDIKYISERIQFAKEGDHNISTLVQIYDYNVIDAGSEEYLFWSQLEHQYFPSSQINNTFILLHFQYFNEQTSLKHIISLREQQLKKYENKYGKDYLKQIQKIKMWDYLQIDKLSSQQRQLINIFFQQIQIVRMIDHIIGALYFLNHFQMEHLAIRPENILIDDEGKYVLIDREIFSKESNYQMALHYVKMKEDVSSFKNHYNQQILSYISPEYIPNLKNKINQVTFDVQKSDIYCVGLVALQMCLLDRKQKYFQYSPYLKNIKMTQFQLNKRLVRAQERYSQQFISLITKMLVKDTNQRINFAQLIDQLNPLLQKNLQALKQLHNNSKHPQLQKDNEQKHENQTHYMSQEDQLKYKLLQIQKQFKKVMSNRFLLFNRNINQIELKQEQSYIFNRLQKITRVSVPFEEKHKINPQFNNNGSQAQNQRRKNDKRYISGKELQEIVLKQYQNIKYKRKIK